MEQTNQVNVPNQNDKEVSKMDKSYDEQITEAMMEVGCLYYEKESSDKQIIEGIKELFSLIYSREQSHKIKEGIRKAKEKKANCGTSEESTGD